jgi:predicted metal-dependent hydrolase
MPKISFSGQEFSYTINRKFIRSLSLRLKSANSFVINCPHLTPDFIVSRFINEHSPWIIKNSSRFHTLPAISSLQNLSILGQNYEVIIKKMARDSVVIFHDEQKIYANTTSLSHLHLTALLDKKFRALALSLINQELSQLSKIHNFKYNHVSVKNTTSRFGSCSSTNNLNFNWQIILFPFPMFQHVLLHELTHLTIKDHSLKFWRQLAIYDPHCGAHRLWLKKEAGKFMIFS